MKRIGKRGRLILDYLVQHDGRTAAEVDRATNHHFPHAHRVTYDAVARLVRSGHLVKLPGGRNGGMTLHVINRG